MERISLNLRRPLIQDAPYFKKERENMF